MSCPPERQLLSGISYEENSCMPALFVMLVASCNPCLTFGYCKLCLLLLDRIHGAACMHGRASVASPSCSHLSSYSVGLVNGQICVGASLLGGEPPCSKVKVQYHSVVNTSNSMYSAQCSHSSSILTAPAFSHLNVDFAACVT